MGVCQAWASGINLSVKGWAHSRKKNANFKIDCNSRLFGLVPIGRGWREINRVWFRLMNSLVSNCLHQSDVHLWSPLGCWCPTQSIPLSHCVTDAPDLFNFRQSPSVSHHRRLQLHEFALHSHNNSVTYFAGSGSHTQSSGALVCGGLVLETWFNCRPEFTHLR